ncbi:MAG: hypothetical protein AAF321_06425, partial [Pseudomonadota bacterium]
LESDPAAMRFALRVPEGLRVRDGDASVFLGHAEASGFAIDGRWTVRRLEGRRPTDAALGPITGTDLGLFALSVADAADMRRVQSAIIARRAAGHDGEGTLSVAMTGCRAGPLPQGPILASAYLSTGPGRRFVPLFVDLDLTETFGDEPGSLSEAPPCGEAPG